MTSAQIRRTTIVSSSSSPWQSLAVASTPGSFSYSHDSSIWNICSVACARLCSQEFSLSPAVDFDSVGDPQHQATSSPTSFLLHSGHSHFSWPDKGMTKHKKKRASRCTRCVGRGGKQSKFIAFASKVKHKTTSLSYVDSAVGVWVDFRRRKQKQKTRFYFLYFCREQSRWVLG